MPNKKRKSTKSPAVGSSSPSNQPNEGSTKKRPTGNEGIGKGNVGNLHPNQLMNVDLDNQRYSSLDSGPFVIKILWKDYVPSQVMKIPVMMKVARDLNKLGIKYNNIEYSGRASWRITAASRDLANQALDNMSKNDTCYKTIIPWSSLFKKLIIKGIPTDISMEELSAEISHSNNNIFIKNINRLKRRDRINNVFVESESVSLTIRTSVNSDYIYIWNMKVATYPFISNIRQCFNCGLLGHSSKFCKNQTRCLNCNQDKHEQEGQCNQPSSCANCKGDHPSLDKKCPRVSFKKEVMRLMATENIEYYFANKEMMASSNNIQRNVELSSDSFPPLHSSSNNKDVLWT